jgi:death-on-curing protein
LIASAILRPYDGHYQSIQRKAAALVESVAKNHGFADGNKRTALILLHVLLEKSGYRLFAANNSESPEDAAEQMVLDVVTGDISFDDLVAWLKLRIRRI